MKKFHRVCISLDNDTISLLECLSDSCDLSKSEFVKQLITGRLQVKFSRFSNYRSYEIYENFVRSDRFNI